MTNQSDNIANRLHVLRSQVAALSDGRHVEIIGVTKQQSDVAIDEALQMGLRCFGENRVQEAERHWQARRKIYPDLSLHFIGPLQTNKATEAVALFDVIETLDRLKLAEVLAAEMDRQNRPLPCFIQVNTGEEPQKSGVHPSELQDLLNQSRQLGLSVVGLMAVPPVSQPPALHFSFLKTLADRHGLTKLSMGMSQDYETAVRCGATHIRIGTALFGPRGV